MTGCHSGLRRLRYVCTSPRTHALPTCAKEFSTASHVGSQGKRGPQTQRRKLRERHQPTRLLRLQKENAMERHNSPTDLDRCSLKIEDPKIMVNSSIAEQRHGHHGDIRWRCVRIFTLLARLLMLAKPAEQSLAEALWRHPAAAQDVKAGSDPPREKG